MYEGKVAASPPWGYCVFRGLVKKEQDPTFHPPMLRYPPSANADPSCIRRCRDPEFFTDNEKFDKKSEKKYINDPDVSAALAKARAMNTNARIAIGFITKPAGEDNHACDEILALLKKKKQSAHKETSPMPRQKAKKVASQSKSSTPEATAPAPPEATMQTENEYWNSPQGSHQNTKSAASRGPRPEEEDEFVEISDDDYESDTLASIIQSKREQVAKVKNSNVPLLLDPKLILSFND